MTISGHVFIATSLDGMIARPNGELDWLLSRGAPSEDHGYDAFIQSMDGIVMGRGTYEKVLTFDHWPYEKPVLVLSKQLARASVPESLKGRVRFSALAPSQAMAWVQEEGWRRVYVDGGQLIQSFLREGLIAELIITQVPVLIGDGRPLFGSLPRDISLTHLKTQAFQSGLVQSHYRVNR
jgi:dihydrofolate reductase